MAAQNVPFLAFNRGLVSRLALARTDLKRTGLSAEIMTNWMPRVLGSMMLRPGTNFIGDPLNDNPTRMLEFVFNLTDTALVELTDSNMRVWVNDALVTRIAVGTAVLNGTFAANLNNWTTLNEQPSDNTTWTMNAGHGVAQLTGDGFNYAILEQQVVVAGADLNKEHALRIVIDNGPVDLLVGNASGDDTYINTTPLDIGTHSLAFTPAGNFWVRFRSKLDRPVQISNCTVEAAGVLILPTPWVVADLGLIRYEQSGDIIYVGCGKTTDTIGYQQRAIERRAVHSWSVVNYVDQVSDGPFLVENVNNAIQLHTDGISGRIDVFSTKPIFRSTHVGALFRLQSQGQLVILQACGADVFTDPIKCTGIGTGRNITVNVINITGNGVTVALERSDNPNGGWASVTTYNVDQVNVNFNDTFDNQIWYYRLHTTIYAGGAVTTLKLQTSPGSITGVVRVVTFTNSTAVVADVLKHLGQLTNTPFWSEGAWSTFRGFPMAPRLHQARLTWAGRGTEWGSVSDGFYSFDDTVIGDSGPFQRAIGSGPIDNINWQLSLTRLLMGGDMAEYEVITSALDEPVTPTNFTLRAASSRGSAQVQALKLDNSAIVATRGGTRVYRLAMDPYIGDYAPTDLTAIVPELFNQRVPGTDITLKRMAIQRLPDTRIHCVRADGQVGVLIFDEVEQVICWVQVTSPAAGGVIEDVVVLPNTPEDAVYYVVRRTINGAVKRFIERWALESEGRGATITKLADACVTYQGAPATVIPVAHLVGQQVAVWADGKDVGTNADYTYSFVVGGGGTIVLPVAASTVIVGLPYTAQWQSAKLAYAAQLGTALLQEKRIPGLGVIMADTHWQGLRYGKDFTHLDSLPLTEDIKPVVADSVWDEYDKPSFDFDGDWDTDSRVCLQAQSPRCSTLLALVATVEVYEKT